MIGEITVSWMAPDLDGGSDITGYLIEYSADGSDPWVRLPEVDSAVTVTDTVTTTYTDTGLGNFVTRHYRVRAINNVGNGAHSVAVSATTPRVINFSPGVDGMVLNISEFDSAGFVAVVDPVQPGGELVVPLTATLVRGASSVDFMASPPTSVTVADGWGVVRVDVMSDDLWDPDEGIEYTFDTASGAWPADLAVGASDTFDVTIVDTNEAPTIAIQVLRDRLAETGGARTATMWVTRSLNGTPEAIPEHDHVLILEFEGTADLSTDGTTNDFTVSGTRIALPAGDTDPADTVTLTVLDDSDDTLEGQEFILVMGVVQTTHGTAVLDAAPWGVSIVETAEALIHINSADPTLEPHSGSTSVPYEVFLSAWPVEDVPLTISVDYSAVPGGTAVTELDHGALSLSTVLFTASDRTVTRSGTVDIVADDLAEVAETLTLTLTSDAPSAVTIVNNNGGSITVADSDSVTASIRRATGQTERVIEGQPFTFEVVLDGAATTDVAVAWSIATDATVITADDFVGTDVISGTVTFPANGNAASRTQVQTLTIADSVEDEGDQSFTVTLGAITSDLGNRATVAAAPNHTITGTIVERDRQPPTLTRFEAPARVNGVGTFTVTFEFNEDVQVAEFTSSDIEVTNGSDAAQAIGEPVATPSNQRRIFTATITPSTNWSNDDAVTVTVSDVPDDVGNDLVSVSRAVTFDTAGPAPTFGPASPGRVSGNFTFTVNFGEAVNGLTAAEVVVTGGARIEAESFDDTNAANGRYTMRIAVPDAVTDGAGIVIAVGNGVATDLAMNASTAAAAMYTVDRTAPIPVFSSPAQTRVNGNFMLTVNFGETVTEFEADDIVVTGHIDAAVDADTFTSTANAGEYRVTIAVPGTVPDDTELTITLRGGAAADLSGNGSNAVVATYTVDRSAPVPAFELVGTTRVSGDFTLIADFGEAMLDLTAAEISISGGARIDPNLFDDTNAVTGRYIMGIDVPEAVADGAEIAVVIADAVATDLAGNGNAAASTSVTLDRTAPTPALLPLSPGQVNGDLRLTVDFGETVTGFEVGEIVASGHASITVDPATFAPTANDGEYQVTIAIPDLVPEGTAVTVTLADGVAVDLAGHGSATVTATYTVDRTAPTVREAVLANGVTAPVMASFDVTVTFSEAVTGVATGSFTVTKGEITAVAPASGQNVYTVSINPLENGSVTLGLNAGGATDLAGNPSVAAADLLSVPAMMVPLTVAIAGDTSVAGTFPVTFTFNRPIDRNTFATSDIVLSAGASAAEPVSATAPPADVDRVFTVQITVATEGEVTVELGAGSVMDADNIGNQAATPFTATVDPTEPAITIRSMMDGAEVADNAEVNADVALTFNFDDDIGTTFTIADVAVSNGGRPRGSLMEITAGRSYMLTVALPPTGSDGPFTVTIAADAVQNAVGLGNAERVLTLIADRTAPVVSFTGLPEHNATNADFSFTITFDNGPVTAFSDRNVSLTGIVGATVALTEVTGGVEYTAAVTLPAVPTDLDADLTIAVAANQVVDAAGNANADATTAVVRADRVPPTVSFQNDPNATITEMFSLTINFSEKVIGFTEDEVSFTNGSGTNLVETSTGNDPSVFTLAVMPTGVSPLTANIAANVVTDLAGNGNTATPAALSTRVALTRPAVIVTSDSNVSNEVGGEVYVSAGTFVVTVTFSEAVSGFGDAAGDIVVTNGIAGAPVDQGGGDIYTVTIKSTVDGAVTVHVPANAARASAGARAGNARSSVTSFTVDQVAPTVSIAVPYPARANGAFPITITFSEPVTGFVAADLAVRNGTVDMLVGMPPTLVGTTGPTALYHTVFTTTVTPSADGEVAIDIPAAAAQDRARHDSAAATRRMVLTDITAPRVRSITSNVSPTVAGAFEVTVTFSEPITEFTRDDLEIFNGMANDPVEGTDAKNCTVIITPTNDGEVRVQVRAGAVADSFGNRNPASTATPLTRVAELPITPDRPTNLETFSGRNTVNLRWQAPANDGGAEITGYRIESSPNGFTEWAVLVSDTASTATTYGHGSLGDAEARHYRVSAINSVGKGGASVSARGVTLPTSVTGSGIVDINRDGRISGEDANAMYFQQTGLEDDRDVRRTLLEPLLPESASRSSRAEVDRSIDEFLNFDVGMVDVNGDGRTDSADARLIYNVKSFPELVGDGSPGSGFLSFRQSLIEPYLSTTVTTDEEMRAVIRLIRNL